MIPAETALQPQERTSARAATVGLEAEDVTVLRGSFAQCGVNLTTTAILRLSQLEHQAFDCCIVKLTPEGEKFLHEFRRSELNHSGVLVGVAEPRADLSAYWKYGLNAVVQLPLQVQETVSALRSACLLTVKQLRRHIRMPFATEVSALADGVALKCISREISGGGIALKVPSRILKATSWMLDFTLPNGKKIHIPGTTCWVRPAEEMLGVLFDPNDKQQHVIKDWIESFLAG